jgi:hypothetical protein
MNTKHIFISAFIALLATSNGCGDANDVPATLKAEIVGTYKGHYAGGNELFEISADGTFVQTFQGGNNGEYTSTGKWIYETNMVLNGTYTNNFTNGVFRMDKTSNVKRSVKISRISFEPFMIPSGMSGCVTNTKVECGTGDWRRDPIRIEIGPWPYFVTKVQDNRTDVK